MSVVKDFVDSLDFDNLYQLNKQLNKKPYHLKVRWYQDSDYYMVSYNDTLSDISLPVVSHANGMIFNKSDNSIAHYSYPKIVNGFDTLSVNLDAFKDNWDNFSVYRLYDGTIIKYTKFSDRDEPLVATNLCVDAKKSKFASKKSFYDLFMETVENTEFNLDDLETDTAYTFLMVNPNNKIIVEHEHHDLICLSAVKLDTLEELSLSERTLNLKTPAAFDLSFEAFSDSLTELSTLPESTFLSDSDLCGYLVLDNTTHKRYKFENALFTLLKDLRGNKENLAHRYLELKQEEKDELYLHYYPDSAETFIKTEFLIDKLVDHVYDLYVKMRIKKEHVDIANPLIRSMLFHIHGLYLDSRVKRNKKNIKEYINTLPPADLASLIL